MDPSHENLLKIPGKKIFQSSFSLKTTLPNPFPGPILTIPPRDPDHLHRPCTNGLDLSNAPPLYIPKNMYFPLKKLYKLFEFEPYRKEADCIKEKWFGGEKQKEKNSGLVREAEWTEEDELILMHSGKKTLEREIRRKRKMETKEIQQKERKRHTLEVKYGKNIIKDY